MKLTKTRAWLLPLIMLILSLLVVGGSLALRFLDLDTYKQEIIAAVQTSLKRELRYDTGDFSFRPGPCFTFNGVRIREKDGNSDFVRAERLTIRIALIPLFYQKVVLTRMELERPLLNLSRDQKGLFNVSDLLRQEPGTSSPRIHALELKKGTVRFTDYGVGPTPVYSELVNTNLHLSELAGGKKCDFNLSAVIKARGKQAPVTLTGSLRPSKEGESLLESDLDLKVRTQALDAAHFWPYYSRYVPFKRLSGDLDLEGALKGKLSSFKSRVNFKISRLVLDYPQVFHALLTPQSVRGSCELNLTGGVLAISSIRANVDGLNVQGSCRISELHQKDPRITARAITTNSFDLKHFRQYIPYGIIVKDTADFIEQKIQGGIFRLTEAKLDGRVSQILHMELGENYNVLSVRAQVQEGVVAYAPGIPTFNGLQGELELSGKNFNLNNMSGRFGGSPFTLSGSITDYPLVTPSSYPFSMIIKPRQQEAAWLLGRGRGQKLSLTDVSTLRLSGAGTTSQYTMKGEWDLGGAACSYQGLFAKPVGRPSTISFQGGFSKEEFRLAALHLRLAPLDLAASAHYRYGGALAMELRTNQFPITEISPLTPLLAPYRPAGRVQGTFHAKGSSLETLDWDGEVMLSGASFKAWEKVKALTNLNGNVRFGGGSLESSQLSGRIGNSLISGKGSVSGFKNPSITLNLSSPLLDLADFGLAPKQPLRAEKVNLSITYRDKNLLIDSLSCQLGHSPITIKGSVQDLEHPHVDLQVSSPHLELEDLAPLSGLSGGRAGGPLTVRAGVSAAEGKAYEVPFKRLRLVALLQDGILNLQPIEANLLDGELSARLRLESSPSGVPHYQMSYSLQRSSADRLLHALGVKKQELTGAISLSGELTSKGESAAEFKKSAQGSLKIKAEHGSIKRFSVLSKVFSILNVSQLLKFQLPDMVSGGMPYNKISGDIAIKDGIASTSNLFLDSDAINVSAVGKVDLVRNELDLTIGVQPLQTVDKVVSHIPIVGWVLTGKDKSLITTYFEAKGRIDDPKVTAVPVKSLAKGVFNIFKRVFELPARLITDTGEVLIGK